jgi:DNA-directed RNA polymerase specialized sigma subunit
MDNIEEIMEKTATKAAEATIEKLMAKGLIRIDNRSAIDKTINLLYKYEQLKLSDQPSTLKRVAQVDVALEQIRDDPFYEIIPLYYFEKETRENIAEYFNVSEKTVTRNRKRLIRQMAVILFSDDVIMDILS